MRVFTVKNPSAILPPEKHFKLQLEGMHEMMRCLTWNGLGIEYVRESKRGRLRGMLLPRIGILGADGNAVAKQLFRHVVNHFECDANLLDSQCTASRSEPGSYAFVPHPEETIKVGISCATAKDSDEREVFISFGDTRFELAGEDASKIIGYNFDDIPTLEDYFKTGKTDIPLNASVINLGGHGDQSDIVIFNPNGLKEHAGDVWLFKKKQHSPLTPLNTATSWGW